MKRNKAKSSTKLRKSMKRRSRVFWVKLKKGKKKMKTILDKKNIMKNKLKRKITS